MLRIDLAVCRKSHSATNYAERFWLFTILKIPKVMFHDGLHNRESIYGKVSLRNLTISENKALLDIDPLAAFSMRIESANKASQKGIVPSADSLRPGNVSISPSLRRLAIS